MHEILSILLKTTSLLRAVSLAFWIWSTPRHSAEPTTHNDEVFSLLLPNWIATFFDASSILGRDKIWQWNAKKQSPTTLRIWHVTLLSMQCLNGWYDGLRGAEIACHGRRDKACVPCVGVDWSASDRCGRPAGRRARKPGQTVVGGARRSLTWITGRMRACCSARQHRGAGVPMRRRVRITIPDTGHASLDWTDCKCGRTDGH